MPEWQSVKIPEGKKAKEQKWLSAKMIKVSKCQNAKGAKGQKCQNTRVQRYQNGMGNYLT